MEQNLTVTIGLRRLEMETGAGETMRKNTIEQTTYLYQMEQWRLKPRQKKLVVTIGHLEESKVQERLTLDMDMLKQE